IDHPPHFGFIGDVGLDEARLPTLLGDRGDGFAAAGFVDVDHDHVRAAGRGEQRRFAAHTAAPARDEDPLAFETDVPACSWSRHGPPLPGAARTLVPELAPRSGAVRRSGRTGPRA